MKPKQTILLFIALLNVFSFQLLAQNTVIKAGHFFDARNGKMLDNQVIIIHDGKIKEVGANLIINKTDTVIDLSNFFLRSVSSHSFVCGRDAAVRWPFSSITTLLLCFGKAQL